MVAVLKEEEMLSQIAGLIQAYKTLSEGGKKLSTISEAKIRADFVDPLFEILGQNTPNPLEYDRKRYVRGAGSADLGICLNERPVLFVEIHRSLAEKEASFLG